MSIELINKLQKARLAMIDARGIGDKYENIIQLINDEINRIQINNLFVSDDLSIQEEI